MSFESRHKKTRFLHLRKQSLRSADQRLNFHYIDITIPLPPNSEKPLAIFYDCTAQFVKDLVGNPEDRYSCVMAHSTISEV